MKEKVIGLLLILVMFSTITFGIYKSINNRIVLTKDNIKYIHYSYSTGDMANSNVHYYIDLVDGKYILSLKPGEVDDSLTKKVVLDEKTIEQLVNRLNKENIYLWNGFRENDKDALDGDSFSLYISTKDNEEINASGYERWPNNYFEVKSIFYSLFYDLYDKD